MFLEILVLLASASITVGLPGLEFMGRGYDVFTGHPRSYIRDDGFKEQQVLHLPIDNVDGIPNDVQVNPISYCKPGSEDVFVERGATSLQASLFPDAGIVIGFTNQVFSAAFTGSQLFKWTVTSMQNENVLVDVVATCLKYFAMIKRLHDVKLSNNFQKDVEILPTTYNDSLYIDFIKVIFVNGHPLLTILL